MPDIDNIPTMDSLRMEIDPAIVIDVYSATHDHQLGVHTLGELIGDKRVELLQWTETDLYLAFPDEREYATGPVVIPAPAH